MSPEVAGKSGAGASTVLRAVRVDLSTHGEWEIELPDQSEPVTCELIVCDAFIASFAARSSAAATISHPPTSSSSTRGAPLLISLGAAPEPQSASCLNPTRLNPFAKDGEIKEASRGDNTKSAAPTPRHNNRRPGQLTAAQP